MRYKALKSFSGVVSMAEGTEQEISDKKVADDLLKARYIEAVEKTPRRKKKEIKTEG